MTLSNAEEQLMQLLWKKEKAFMKDLIDAYPDPKPATTTIATLLKRMQDKNFVDYVQYGRSREYFPLVKKKVYFSKQVKSPDKSLRNNEAHTSELVLSGLDYNLSANLTIKFLIRP